MLCPPVPSWRLVVPASTLQGEVFPAEQFRVVSPGRALRRQEALFFLEEFFQSNSLHEENLASAWMRGNLSDSTTTKESSVVHLWRWE